MRVVLFMLILLVGCHPEIPGEALHQLNGYWEIEKVTFPNGQTKDFMASTTIDYIEVKDRAGFRKKVQPKFDGTFETSNDAELFKIISNGNSFQFEYTGSSETWMENLIELSADRFSVTNRDTLTYTYKRYQPMNLEQ